MQRFILLMALCAPFQVFADAVSIPWAQFKQMYDAQLRQQLQPAEKDPYYTLKNAHYALRIGAGKATGTVTFTGQWLQGTRHPIVLLQGMTIARTVSIENGTLVRHQGAVALLPDNNAPFSVRLDVVAPVLRDETSQYVDFQPVWAVQNQLAVTLDKSLQLLAHPGVADDAGVFYLQHDNPSVIRFQNRQLLLRTHRYELVTVLRVDHAQLIARVWIDPLSDDERQTVQLTVPKQAQRLAASIPEYAIQQQQEHVTIDTQGDVFWIDYLLPIDLDQDMSFTPFRLAQQSEKHHRLMLEPSPQGRLQVTNESVQQVSTQALGDAWATLLPKQPVYRVPNGQPATLRFQAYDVLPSPPTVLDHIEYFTVIDDSGKMLSTLRLTLPSGYGQHFRFSPPEQAKIWSLTVNGRDENVYRAPSGQWAIPLATNTISQIEIALIQTTDKLQLQGRLPIAVPSFGIAAKHICVVVALPSRVKITQVEGDLTVASEHSTLPKTVFGEAVFFQQALYQGNAFHVAFHYQEPIE